VNSSTMALWFGNYANLATKAQRPMLAARFGALSRFFAEDARRRILEEERSGIPMIKELSGLISECASEAYPQLQRSAGMNRGVLRAYTWGNKVATILKSVVSRLEAKGDALLAEGQAFFVCDACGFMFVGSAAPEICPVCKAPASRFARY